jgi:hypothetical protein
VVPSSLVLVDAQERDVVRIRYKISCAVCNWDWVWTSPDGRDPDQHDVRCGHCGGSWVMWAIKL